MKHRMPLIAISVGLLIAGALAMAGPAAAAGHAAAKPGPGHRYCAGEAIPAGSGLQTAPGITCYASFAASIRAATHGRVRLPRTAGPRTVTAAELNAPASDPGAAATTYVLSIDFQNANYGGTSLAWYQSTKCGAFYASAMPSGWNDTISSVIAYNGCATTLFHNASFAGSTYAIEKNGSASTLGSFNDEASSQTWCTSYPCGA